MFVKENPDRKKKNMDSVEQIPGSVTKKKLRKKLFTVGSNLDLTQKNFNINNFLVFFHLNSK